MSKQIPSITGSTLKLIAVCTMFLDHFAVCVLNYGLLRLEHIQNQPELWNLILDAYRILRLIGRIAFPIFCFLLVEGFLHTRNAKKYALRLFLFALISEIPFDLAIRNTLVDFRYQNVFFTLLIGLLVMMLCSRLEKHRIIQAAVMSGGLLCAQLLHTDYSYKGVLLIEILYLLRYHRAYQAIAGAAAFSWELTAPLAFIPIWYYNGQRGLSIRWFFYWFYPVHLLLLYGIKSLLPLL